MCGIVGYVGPNEATDILMDGLRRLEYRGYDSAGLAVMNGGPARIVRAKGKLTNLTSALRAEPLEGTTGIGHTRWATHGRPSVDNAHPHKSGGITVVHNGIIENHSALRDQLKGLGRTIASETDTELVAHLVDIALAELGDPIRALQSALAQIQGAYALAILIDAFPDRMFYAKEGSPLIVGIGDGESFLGSDIPALLGHTRDMVFLEDGQLGELRADGIRLFDAEGREQELAIRHITWNAVAAEKEGYKHFMLKEIHEQPRAVTDTLRGRLSPESGDAHLDGFEIDPAGLGRIFLLGCGTSYHACLVGKFLIEGLARVPVEVDLGSEFRYRDPLIGKNDLLIAVSQSGETADTLAAVKSARERGARVLAIANVVESQIPRSSDAALYTHAGPEIGVASTKAFTTQLAALVLVAIHLARRTGALPQDQAQKLVEELLHLPKQMGDVIENAAQLNVIGRRYATARSFLYLGRGINYPIALEGALKLKEISYIHAEGYPAGEMKHGPIALIDEELPVVVIAPQGPHYEKVMSNLAEVRARQGKIIAVGTRGDAAIGELVDDLFLFPHVTPWLQPLLTVLPLQLLAYHIADFKGTDVDQPRNLAKSVTVE
ncbi:MAG: glutamine--fructose-6-phosphate transaminase (isomerizing) [bacterium]